MSAPLPEADYLRPIKRLGSKEEVLNMLREHVANGCIGKQESSEERMERKHLELHEADVWHANTFCGPGFVPVGPMQPSRSNDDRFRDFIGRYGNMRND